MVKAADNFPGQFQMRQLILAYRHGVGFVKDDVGGLQHRIAHQPVVDAFLGFLQLPHLFLESRHPQQPAQRRYHTEQGMQAHHFRHMGLDKEDGLRRVNAGGQPVQGHFMDVGADFGHLARIFNSGQGVDVDDAVDAAVILLQVDPVFQSAQVVAQMQPPGGAHPG